MSIGSTRNDSPPKTPGTPGGIGDRPVSGAGPAGTLAADRFEIRDGGDVLRFEGRVKVTVQPEPPRGAAS